MKAARPHSILATAAVVAATAGGAAFSCPAEQPLSYLGSPAPAAAGVDEVVVITNETRYVNVTGGTIVKFVARGRSFNWSFQSIAGHVIPFDLGRIAPSGFLHHPVKTYVAEDPLYQG